MEEPGYVDDEPDVEPPDWKLVTSLDEWSDWLSHVSESTALMQHETPRGAAVLARAYLEDALDTALLTAAINDTSARRDLIKRASEPFPNKIDAWAKYAGLSASKKHQMHLLVKLGNAFAHRPRAASLTISRTSCARS